MGKTSSLKRLWRLIASEQSEIRNIYVFSVFQGLVSLSLPLGIQAIINLLQAGQLRASWIVLVAFVLLGILFYGILQLRQLSITESIEQRLFTKSAFDLAYRLPRVSQDSITGKYIPEMMNRFFEVMTIQKGISKLLIDFSAAAVQIAFGLLLLSFYHPLFIMLGVILVALLIIIFRITGPAGLKSSLEESTHKFAVAHWLEEVSRTLMTFKLSGNSDLPLKKTDHNTSKYLDARLRHYRVLMTQYKVLIFFKLVVAAALIIAGSFLVVQGKMNIGQFVAAEIIIIMVINSVEKIILNMSTVYDVLTALEKVGSLTDMPLERDSGYDISSENSSGGLSLKINELTFQFKDASKPTLNNVSLTINSGEKLCLSGDNGSGKTLLLKLISGLYENYSGSIVINDIPLENINLSSLRSMIGENFTEQEIFKGTISDNIVCGRPGIGLKDVAEVSAAVHLSGYIESLDNGYATELDPEGKRMSSGILRKIILARCLINNPKLLLLEDNLNSLSPQERTHIIDTILIKRPEMTVIIISNDPEIQRKSNRVYSLND